MAEFKNQTFTDQTVDLDGNHYDGCRFVGCTLRYSAGGEVRINACHFDRCGMALDGAAARTVGYLTAIHGGLGDWGRKTVENLCGTIQASGRPN